MEAAVHSIWRAVLEAQSIKAVPAPSPACQPWRELTIYYSRSVKIILQLFSNIRIFQPPERFGLNLADALSGYIEFPAHFL